MIWINEIVTRVSEETSYDVKLFNIRDFMPTERDCSDIWVFVSLGIPF